MSENSAGVPVFSRSYQDARAQFLAAASARAARLFALPLAQAGPEGGRLSIDIAWFGSTAPSRLLVQSSGIHGVEGYAGSAIQRALLQDLPPLDADCALVLVHALNPYGMAWLRRCNEANVDLNRNFLLPGDDWTGSPPAYADLMSFLNPPQPPARDLFLAKALRQIARYGYKELKQAIAAGQYDYPQGLFYGGSGLEEGPRRYREWLFANTPETAEVFVIDIHTGLGPSGVGSLLHRAKRSSKQQLDRALSRPVLEEESETKVVGYPIRGSLSNLYVERFGPGKVDFITQEFGTFSNLRVLKALRDENQHHHYGSGAVDHWTKAALKEAFCPSSARWQETVTRQGVRLAKEAASYLFSGKQDC